MRWRSRTARWCCCVPTACGADLPDLGGCVHRQRAEPDHRGCGGRQGVAAAWRAGDRGQHHVPCRPWADALFAMDRKWWEFHYEEVCTAFSGRRLTVATLDKRFEVEKLTIQSYRNSGAGCVSVAEQAGAKSITLLGFDCMADAGKTHWHGSHPVGLSDAKTIKVWPLIFDRLAKDMKRKGVNVVNASRRTALKCFARGDIAELLHP